MVVPYNPGELEALFDLLMGADSDFYADFLEALSQAPQHALLCMDGICLIGAAALHEQDGRMSVLLRAGGHAEEQLRLAMRERLPGAAVIHSPTEGR